MAYDTSYVATDITVTIKINYVYNCIIHSKSIIYNEQW